MVEGGAKEVPEELLLSALEKAVSTITDLCSIQLELRKLVRKRKASHERGSGTET